MVKVLAVAAAVLLAAAAVAIALAGRPFHGSSEPRENKVIAAVMKAPYFGTHLFPRTVGKRTCTVHGGGPAPGTTFPGAICKTQVRFDRGGTASVYFTHWIQGKPHTWLYRVSPSLHVHFVRDFGTGIAPEYWS